ncbi:MAG: oxygen-independent coproporphyrinogen III oxidase, partial [Pseudomonadales bacterium]|nr:oxygen-independent coproporphyrinogen III oxidase [Pseudomonadales bacterium]
MAQITETHSDSNIIPLKSRTELLQKGWEWDDELIKRYNLSGPRYTSYPTAIQFTEGFNVSDCTRAAQYTQHADDPISLYLHIPFCAHICYYCACNKVITKRREKSQPYLDRLYQDIAQQAKLYSGNRPVEQLHWGGGTPTFITQAQMRDLMACLNQHFNLINDGSQDYSIEIDPREANGSILETLRDIGFNRISLGVQDFNPAVQKAVNRIQSEAETRKILEYGRELGFKSINVDLIYGLPLQTRDTFQETLERVIDMSPDRLSVFNYAHMPSKFMPQRRIQEQDLPAPAEKLIILENTIRTLTSAGYRYIGMDHFAKPNDELSIAQDQGKLHRNFQGYTTHSHCDLVSMGVSAISQIGNCYYQNHHDLDTYLTTIDQQELPVKRGVWMTADDSIRRNLIMQLICHFNVDIQKFEQQNNIVFSEYFSSELKRLQSMEKDGLLTAT